MHSDRELLALAAKAAGLQLCGYSWIGENEDDDECEVLESAFVKIHPEQELATKWNPLTDDGDALRLAVKLNLHICIDAESAGAITVEWGFDEGGCAQYSVVENSQDEPSDCAATRRAIVRAASAIGEAMQ